MAGRYDSLAAEVAALVHAKLPWDGASVISKEFNLGIRFDEESKPEKYYPILQYFLHELMNNGGMSLAAKILWSPNQFTADPKSVQDVWNLFETSSQGLIMGAAAMGKSFSMGVRLFLEWLRDPEWTSIRVVGPSEDHLEQNLFSHLVSLHSQATLPMPGETGDLFIGMNRRNQLGSIRGIVIPKSNTKKAGRLQGGHRKPRKQLHPRFGPLSRMFIFIDEIENVPMGIWHDIDNVLSEISGDGGFKIFGAYNPSNLGDEVAKHAEPTFGWANINEDEHYRWVSGRGWDVLRIDAERCENVITGKMIYPGLQSREGLGRIANSSGGRQSAGYMTMGRGMYPKQGTQLTVIPPGMLQRMRAEFIWLESPTPVGGCDLALDGGDDCVYVLGKWGLAVGMRFAPSVEFPDGKIVKFKDEKGNAMARWGLQADKIFTLPKGETVAMKTTIIDFNKKAGVKGAFFACDRTGHGAGVADLIRYEWSSEIHDVNYSESASKDKLMLEDTKTCYEQYERMATELWFALRQWGEFGYFVISPTVDMMKLGQQLTQRLMRTGSAKLRVESKSDYESRGFTSPNEADALTLFVHAARKGSSVTISMKGESEMPSSGWEDDWPGSGLSNGVKIDDSNRTDVLTEREEMPTPGGGGTGLDFDIL
ncbi:MAG TPA: hypothetical protein VLF94_01910 [Chlamydiales bacterium]|nr:hypothetical protein [Chlamydiales bacterium]